MLDIKLGSSCWSVEGGHTAGAAALRCCAGSFLKTVGSWQ